MQIVTKKLPLREVSIITGSSTVEDFVLTDSLEIRMQAIDRYPRVSSGPSESEFVPIAVVDPPPRSALFRRAGTKIYVHVYVAVVDFNP